MNKQKQIIIIAHSFLNNTFLSIEKWKKMNKKNAIYLSIYARHITFSMYKKIYIHQPITTNKFNSLTQILSYCIVILEIPVYVHFNCSQGYYLYI